MFIVHFMNITICIILVCRYPKWISADTVHLKISMGVEVLIYFQKNKIEFCIIVREETYNIGIRFLIDTRLFLQNNVSYRMVFMDRESLL